jgi:hypothetical protein
MIDPNKLPTAAMYWPAISTEPAIVTVDDIVYEHALTRKHGKLRLSDLYDIDNEQQVNELYNRFRAFREEYIALKTLAG